MTDPTNWLAALDDLAARYTEASEAHDIFQNDALHSDPSDDEAEDAAEAISEECLAIRTEIRDLLAPVTDREILDVFEGEEPNARSAALAAELQRRNVDF